MRVLISTDSQRYPQIGECPLDERRWDVVPINFSWQDPSYWWGCEVPMIKIFSGRSKVTTLSDQKLVPMTQS